MCILYLRHGLCWCVPWMWPWHDHAHWTPQNGDLKNVKKRSIELQNSCISTTLEVNSLIRYNEENKWVYISFFIPGHAVSLNLNDMDTDSNLVLSLNEIQVFLSKKFQVSVFANHSSIPAQVVTFYILGVFQYTPYKCCQPIKGMLCPSMPVGQKWQWLILSKFCFL